MKTRIAVVCVVVASALTLAGCGTVDNICLENEQTGQVPMHIYGGRTAFRRKRQTPFRFALSGLRFPPSDPEERVEVSRMWPRESFWARP